MKRMFMFFATLWLGIMGASAQGYHYDVNNDGSVNVSDAVAVVNRILGKTNAGDVGGGEAIDLGLPSGTLWSSCNIGASSPEEYGNYYAWGETEVKDVYDWSKYIHCDGSKETCHDLGSDIGGTEYDVAHMKWGDDWRMPTFDEFQELIDNCDYEWITYQGVQGGKFTGPNGNSIFLPAAGVRTESGLEEVGSNGYYWSSMHFVPLSGSNHLYLSSSVYFCDDWLYRCYGQCVRPVRPGKNSVPAKAIDLGLPSGTKWANCNVGATKPEEYGDYFAWGEIGTKLDYSEDTYFFNNNGYTSLGIDISGTKYDVARMKWGGSWVMPTLDDVKELLNNCTREWTTLHGVDGLKFTSKNNGNSIFLPAAGQRWGGDLDFAGERGYYWSSTQHPDDSYGAYYLHFYSGYASWYSDYRRLGWSVRPVVRN